MKYVSVVTPNLTAEGLRSTVVHKSATRITLIATHGVAVVIVIAALARRLTDNSHPVARYRRSIEKSGLWLAAQHQTICALAIIDALLCIWGRSLTQSG
jgi:hypothetical protein